MKAPMLPLVTFVLSKHASVTFPADGQKTSFQWHQDEIRRIQNYRGQNLRECRNYYSQSLEIKLVLFKLEQCLIEIAQNCTLEKIDKRNYTSLSKLLANIILVSYQSITAVTSFISHNQVTYNAYYFTVVVGKIH